MGTSKRIHPDSESRRSVQGGIGFCAQYIPEHDPEQLTSVGDRRYAGYSVQPVPAGGKEAFRKGALNGSGTA